MHGERTRRVPPGETWSDIPPGADTHMRALSATLRSRPAEGRPEGVALRRAPPSAKLASCRKETVC